MAFATREITQHIVRHTCTVDQHHAMDEAGISHPDDRGELVLGKTLDVLPIGANQVS